MIKHFCDHCGSEITKKDDRIYVRAVTHQGDTPCGMRLEYDLCSKCKHELEKFLGGTKDAK